MWACSPSRRVTLNRLDAVACRKSRGGQKKRACTLPKSVLDSVDQTKGGRHSFITIVEDWRIHPGQSAAEWPRKIESSGRMTHWGGIIMCTFCAQGKLQNHYNASRRNFLKGAAAT